MKVDLVKAGQNKQLIKVAKGGVLMGIDSSGC
jgi:hypothetical protein